MSQNDRPEAPSPATAANGSTAAKEENPTARALVSSSKAEAESEQGAQSGGVRRLAIDVLPSGFHRTGEVPSAKHAQCSSRTQGFSVKAVVIKIKQHTKIAISSRLASCRKSYMQQVKVLLNLKQDDLIFLVAGIGKLSVLEQHFSCSSSLPHQWKIWNPYGRSNTPYG
uniref:Uncharacterized protein n=1 Tax=Arachis duranensis TaxID=130453 RepID=N1NEX4_ARADU|nr:hypothetical protein ARAX_ADH079023-072J06-016 [Arachis duranensis]